jgi:hypothetical protein
MVKKQKSVKNQKPLRGASETDIAVCDVVKYTPQLLYSHSWLLQIKSFYNGEFDLLAKNYPTAIVSIICKVNRYLYKNKGNCHGSVM